MTYYENLYWMTDNSRHPKRFIAKEYKDSKGLYWRCIVTFNESNHRAIVCCTDTLEEIYVFCDINGIQLSHVEHM